MAQSLRSMPWTASTTGPVSGDAGLYVKPRVQQIYAADGLFRSLPITLNVQCRGHGMCCYKSICFCIIAAVLIYNPFLSGGINTIQEYTEKNIYGITALGYYLAAEGDVNGDGFDDFLISEGSTEFKYRSVYLFLGGESVSQSPEMTWTSSINESKRYYGTQLSICGDFNGDGYNDIIINGDKDENNIYPIFLYYGGPTQSSEPDISFDLENYPNRMTFTGDLNHDGFDEIMVSDINNICAYIYFGNNAGDTEVDLILSDQNEVSSFGYFISPAGDVNQDGYDDVLIAANGYRNFGLDNKVYLYLGGIEMDTIPDLVLQDSNADDYGECVGGGKDLNNDGYDDFVILSDYSSGRELLIFLGNSELDDQPDYTIPTPSADLHFWYEFALLEDVNGDHYDEIAITTVIYELKEFSTALYYGADIIDSSVDFYLTNHSYPDGFGIIISSAGDSNNDGYGDILIGHPPYHSSTGCVYLYNGNINMNNNPDWVRTGIGSYNHFGTLASIDGDLNGDGFSDLVAASRMYKNKTGRVYVYWGGISPDNIADMIITGQNEETSIGMGFGSAGDLNADGYDDLVISYPNENNRRGQVKIFWGGAVIDTINPVIINGFGSFGYFGCSLCTSGDYNNDGINDLVIGAKGQNEGYGRAYLYYGGPDFDSEEDLFFDGAGSEMVTFSTSLSTMGDFDNDGYDDLMIGDYSNFEMHGKVFFYRGGSPMDNEADFILIGESYGSEIGLKLTFLNDINGDGYDDIAILDQDDTAHPPRIHFILGRPSFDQISLSEDCYSISISQNSDLINFAGAGDINKDGYFDFIINYPPDQDYSDLGAIYYGNSVIDFSPDIPIRDLTNNFGGVRGLGDVNNDGVLDFVIMAPSDDIHKNGKVYIFTTYVQSSIKIFLEGPYQGNSMGYVTGLNNPIPLQSPYGDSIKVSELPDCIVDWVLVQLKSNPNGDVISQRSFFLRNDGYIVDIDGITTDLKIPGLADGDYYIIVRHRNHLAVMSSNAVPMTIE
jgi:hypothetical protein